MKSSQTENYYPLVCMFFVLDIKLDNKFVVQFFVQLFFLDKVPTQNSKSLSSSWTTFGHQFFLIKTVLDNKPIFMFGKNQNRCPILVQFVLDRKHNEFCSRKNCPKVVQKTMSSGQKTYTLICRFYLVIRSL